MGVKDFLDGFFFSGNYQYAGLMFLKASADFRYKKCTQISLSIVNIEKVRSLPFDYLMLYLAHERYMI